MIKSFSIQNFKSLTDFKINLSKFNCIIGTNNSGKSSVLQAVDFLSQIIKGTVKIWLSEREWDKRNLLSDIKNPIIKFSLEVECLGKTYNWTGNYNLIQNRCSEETIEIDGARALLLKKNYYTLEMDKKEKIKFKYFGSIMSSIDDRYLSQDLKIIKNFFHKIQSYDMLNPYLMRKKVATKIPEIGIGGEKISSFLHDLSSEQKKKIIDMVNKFFNKIIDYETINTRSGWKRLFVSELYNEEAKTTTEATHVSDGILRILAIASQTLSNYETLLFDEIENGLNPEILELLVKLLIDSNKQIIFTTHNPVLINFIEDSVAKESIHLIYRDRFGKAKDILFYDIDAVKEKTEFLGPGEAMLDIDMTKISEYLVEKQ